MWKMWWAPNNACRWQMGFNSEFKGLILYIRKNVCMFVSLYLIQIHISEPIGTKLCTCLPRRLEEAVGYVWAHNISPFPPFRPTSSGAGAHSCAVHGRRCHTAPLLRYLHDATCAGVTSRTVRCAMLMERSERNACAWKWKPDETGSQWLMICTCGTNELHFQLHCIATNYNVQPIRLRPSFFHSLSTDNIFLYLL